MSLSYSSRIIAEARITYVSGTKALGSSLLRMNVEFQQPAWEAAIGQASAAIHSAVLSLRTDSGGGELGRACPDHPMVLKSGPHSTTVHQTFSIRLSDAQMFAVEEARKGGGIELVLNLIAEGHGEYGHQVISDNISHRVPLSEWARILRELGHGDIIVLGVHLPSGQEGARLRSAIELLHTANRYLVSGEYDIVVARCRQAIESVQAVVEDGESTKEAMTLYRKDRASREGMSSLQREQVILETVRHYANPAHHVDQWGNTECYGRADATFLLALAAAAVTRACARARIESTDTSG
ncbi:hypothetical protein [Burkholderia cenocepacia]|uniref:hypothetical protein n=1 Tax=Burkholderia cenocepacia TaxID=95486 RepID=UPI002AB75384|nr:hypothetical protein [Burkholderia cenocepacia]